MFKRNLPTPVINLEIVNEIYSGINAVESNPKATFSKARIDAGLLPILSERVPYINDPTNIALM